MRGLAVTAALLAAGRGAAAQNSTGGCAGGLHLILARGTGEDLGSGLLDVLGEEVGARIGGTVVQGLDYPATLSDPAYDESVGEGASDMKGAVTGYHDECPEGKIAIMGYSQGAHLTTDALCGGYSGFANITPVASDVVENNIVAVVLFGDPTHVANTTYDRGTSVNNGIFERTNITLCEQYDDRLVSYCDTGDIYCDSGDNQTVHGMYSYRYGDEAVDYIVDRYENGGAAATSSASATTSGGGSGPSNTGSAAGPTPTDGAGAAVVPGGAVMVAAPLAMMAMLFHLL